MYYDYSQIIKNFIQEIDDLIAVETEDAFSIAVASDKNRFSYMAGHRQGLYDAKKRLIMAVEDAKKENR